MKKHFLKFLIIIMFFMFPLVVKANFGDVRYEITDVDLKNSNITFKGWAYIHKTNNYINVEDKKGNIIAENGGQKVIIQAYAGDKLLKTATNSIKEEDAPNYNFYCELYYFSSSGKHSSCNETDYKNKDYNICKMKEDTSSQCYYEDVYFEITFDTTGWNITSKEKITFKIAVSNNFFENVYKDRGYTEIYEYEKDIYTKPEFISVAYASISNYSNDYIKIDKDSVAKKVRFIANSGLLKNIDAVSYNFRYNGTCTYGAWNDTNQNSNSCGGNGKIHNICGDVYELYDGDLNYPNGRSNFYYECPVFLKKSGNKCIGTNYYAIKVSKSPKSAGCMCFLACPCTDNNCSVAVARGSHVKQSTGKFKVIVENEEKKCPVTKPLLDKLQCNNNGTLTSSCDELTVKTSEGSAVVKIKQVGTVSSVLTPDTTYAGGGFKFGITYYNNIKWSYVGKKPNDKLHKAVNSEMNKKIKDFNLYIADINITNLKLGNASIKSGMVKKCYSSSNNKNYYGNTGVTVSCVFTFPDSIIKSNGDVNYVSVSNSSLNINNKYYTEIKDKGEYPITATIIGMSRITDTSAKNDSADKNKKPWTGLWEESIDGCVINLYPLLKTKPKDDPGSNVLTNNFMYRPIDINNPFPNRNAGINWFDWYKISTNKEKLANTYSFDNLQYKAVLNNDAISSIKIYNKDKNYLNWDSIDDKTGESSFVNDYNYVVRVGGN